jgi:hypothetical protein
MAKEKQKEKVEEQEPEIFINPRMKSMCEYERKQNPQACEGCDGIDIMDGLFCKNNTISWRLSQMDKTLQRIGEILVEIKNK